MNDDTPIAHLVVKDFGVGYSPFGSDVGERYQAKADSLKYEEKQSRSQMDYVTPFKVSKVDSVRVDSNSVTVWFKR